MDRRPATVRRLLLSWAVLALLAAAAAVAMTAGAGPLYRHQAIELAAAFDLLRKGAWIGLAGAAAGLIGAAAAAFLRKPWTAAISVLALLAGAGAFAWPYALYRAAVTTVPIHDIATDPSHPPQFVALAPLRKASPNGLEYGGGGAQVAAAEHDAIAHFLASPPGRHNPHAQQVAAACTQWGPQCLAAAQRAFYPGIEPLPAPGDNVDVAFAAALAVARNFGWTIAAVDNKNHHFEATATTRWFGFQDDVAVDVSAVDGGSVVNVRSESRLGLSDLGENARRVRAYLGRVAEALSRTPPK